MAITKNPTCLTCKKDFKFRYSSANKYCSKECYHNSKKRVADYRCIDCNKNISPVKGIKRCKPCSGLVRRGKKHHYWKGALVSYRALHKWVERELGKPIECEACSKKGGGHNMHWANLSGEYKREVSDWIRLCPSCHGEFDSQKRLLDNRNGL